GDQGQREFLTPGERAFMGEQRVVCSNGPGRCVARHELVSAEKEVTGESDETFSDEVIEIGRPLLMRDSDARQQSVGDDTGGCEWRQPSSARTAAYANRHQK